MDRKRELAVITGASGFIGSALINRLGTDVEVVGLDRPGAPHPPANADAIDFDITSDASVQETLRTIRQRHGARIASVVHLAGYYSFSGEPSPLYDDVNVRGTARLLAALQGFDVEQLVFASTMLVHAPCHPGSYINENSPLEPTWAYPESKLATEEVVRQQRSRIPVVIARMAGVYDDLGHSPSLANHVQRIYERDLESHLFPGHISHGQSVLHLDDLLDFFVNAIRRRHELPREFTVLVGESEPLNYDELQHILGHLIHGEDWETYQIPKPIAKAGAWLKRALPGEEFIKPWMIERAEDHYALDIRRAQQFLDWRPRHHLRETLPRIIEKLKQDPSRWYRENELEPSSSAKNASQETGMATHQLQRAQWQPYFDRVSRNIGGLQAEIETAGLKLGAQVNQEWTALSGLAYDPKDDVFEVLTDNLDHLIPHPTNIYVEEAGAALRSIEIIDANGDHQIVKLKQPLALPAS